MKGFSLVEIVIVIAIISALIASMTPFYNQISSWFEVRSAVQQVSNVFERAKTLSVAQVGDDDWSVKFATTSLIVFRGNDFTNRDNQFDEEYILSSRVGIETTLDPVIFDSFTGFINTTSTTTISILDVSKNILITPEGAINY